MDTIKIGAFLAELRHERHLTQEELGEKLGVTNKTVSRWENGNYMPPVEMLMEISSLYSVSINEILSGKRLEKTEIAQAADINLTAALSDSFSLRERIDYFRKKWIKEHIFSLIIQAVILAAMSAAGFVFDIALVQPAVSVIMLILIVVWRNRMQAYIEKNAYNGKGK